MDTLRIEAYKLRLKGKSYNEIQKSLGIPKSTLSGWFKNVVLSEGAHSRLKARVKQGTQNGLIRRNKEQTHEARKRNRSIRSAAQREIREMTLDDLKLIGIALYWAEGYKRAKFQDGRELTWHTISFVNSDPEMICLFVRFLREVMDVPSPSIRLTMRLYPHINELRAKEFWARCTGLPSEQFFKTGYPVSGATKRIRPYNRLPWGILHVEVCSTAQFHRLMGWIEGMKARA